MSLKGQNKRELILYADWPRGLVAAHLAVNWMRRRQHQRGWWSCPLPRGCPLFLGCVSRYPRYTGVPYIGTQLLLTFQGVTLPQSIDLLWCKTMQNLSSLLLCQSQVNLLRMWTNNPFIPIFILLSSTRKLFILYPDSTTAYQSIPGILKSQGRNPKIMFYISLVFALSCLCLFQNKGCQKENYTISHSFQDLAGILNGDLSFFLFYSLLLCASSVKNHFVLKNKNKKNHFPI